MPVETTGDGHVWGYGVTGPDDGPRAILHHGIVGDRGIPEVWSELIRKAGIRVVSIERPGYGETPPRSMQRIAEWPDLVAPLLDRAGVPERFDAVGISAGAPYAYALAAAFPDRVRRVTILSGVPFVHVPEVLGCYESSRRATYESYATQSDEEVRRHFKRHCEELQTGPAEALGVEGAVAAIMRYECAGPAREAKLQVTDWGFSPSSIRCPVDLWHSRGDEVIPFAAAECSARLLPHAALHVDDSGSHFTSLESFREMVAVLGEPTTGVPTSGS